MKIYKVGQDKKRVQRLTELQAWLLQEGKALSGESLTTVAKGISSLGKIYHFSLKGKDLYRFSEEFCQDRRIDQELWIPCIKKGQSRIPKAALPSFKKSDPTSLAIEKSRPQPAKRPHAQLSIRFITVSYQINHDSGQKIPKHALFAVAYERHTGFLFHALISNPFSSDRANNVDEICSSFKPKLFSSWLDSILEDLEGMPVREVFLPIHSPKNGLQGLIPPQRSESRAHGPNLESYNLAIQLITEKLGEPMFSFCPLLAHGHLRIEGSQRFGDLLNDIDAAVLNYNRYGQADPPFERMRRALQLWN